MHVPRRHSRRLLLPPGWVALGFLLLLGCQALLAHRRQLRQYGVMQLTMPPVTLDTAMARLMGKDYDIPYMSLSELDTVRAWHNVEYRGRLLTDADNRLHIAVALQAIKDDTARAGGVRIRLHEHATYTNFIEALDMMNIYNQKKYFLDVRHQTITLYAITSKSKSGNSSQLNIPPCGGMSYYVPLAESAFQQEISALLQQVWRPFAFFFTVVSLLSFYRLARPRPSIR